MEESSSSEPPLCPCGFWGSTKTLGLCSKCYVEYVERSAGRLDGAGFDWLQHQHELLESDSNCRVDCADLGSGQVAGSQAKAGRSGRMDSNSKHCPSRSSADNLGKQPSCGEEPKDGKALPTSCASSSAVEDPVQAPLSEAGSSSRQTSGTCGMEEMVASMSEGSLLGRVGEEDNSASTSQSVDRPCAETSPTPKPSELSGMACGPPTFVTVEDCANEHVSGTREPSPVLASSNLDQSSSREKVSELAAQEKSSSLLQGTKRSHDEVEQAETGSPSPVKQKNKKRCFKCSAKLELAQREIGRCRCGGVFCSLHRHPEAHGCDFDHKEDGRREAREKMVKPTRHLGTSFRRIDSS